MFTAHRSTPATFSTQELSSDPHGRGKIKKAEVKFRVRLITCSPTLKASFSLPFFSRNAPSAQRPVPLQPWEAHPSRTANTFQRHQHPRQMLLAGYQLGHSTVLPPAREKMHHVKKKKEKKKITIKVLVTFAAHGLGFVEPQWSWTTMRFGHRPGLSYLKAGNTFRGNWC